MSTADMIFSTLVVMVVTWFPVWAAEREMGLWKFTKIVFLSVLCLSELDFLVFSDDVEFLKGVFGGLLIAFLSLFGARLMYFWQDMFKGRL